MVRLPDGEHVGCRGSTSVMEFSVATAKPEESTDEKLVQRRPHVGVVVEARQVELRDDAGGGADRRELRDLSGPAADRLAAPVAQERTDARGALLERRSADDETDAVVQ